MGKLFGELFVSLNQNITFIGKLWLSVFLLLRVSILLFAGIPLFWNDEKRFVCNTVHPGCANVCFDIFAPFSLCHFWLLQLVCVCLPTIMYVTHYTQRVFTALTFSLKDLPPAAGRNEHIVHAETEGNFTGPYLLHLVARVFMEVAFGTGQYFLYGLSVSQDFLCLEEPCIPAVECFTSQPTEKSFLLQWMFGNAVLSVILSISEMLILFRHSVRQKNVKETLTEEQNQRQRWSEVNNEADVPSNSLPSNFRKRMLNDDQRHTQAFTSCSEQKCSKLALCSGERMRPQNNSCEKNSSFKAPSLFIGPETELRNPTPPRTCRLGQFTLATLMTEQASDSGESQDKKEWV